MIIALPYQNNSHKLIKMPELIIDKNGIWIDELESKVSFPEEGYNVNFKVEDNSFWFKHRNNIIKKVIERFPFKGNFADIGGGNGFQAKFISENFTSEKVILLEPGYQGCLNAKKRGLENIFNIPFQKFNFQQNNVDAVGLFDVIEHIEDDVKFLNQLKLQLPSKSIIYITVPAHKYLWSDIDNNGGHFRRYNLEMIEALANKSQVELVYFSYFFSYVPFITYFVKHLPYKLRGKRNKTAILDSETELLLPPRFISKFFNLFHKSELKAFEKGLIKHGGSCFAVFRT